MSAAGSNGSNIANKYKDKGLRVIAIDRDGRSQAQSQVKWKNAGANFPLYTRNGCCFQPFYSSISGYPYNVAIKEWKKTELASGNEDYIKWAFGF